MADNDNRYKLWQTISKEYDLPDYNQFSKDMEDATKRKSLHDAVSTEYDLPDFDQFSKDMGYETQTTQQGNQNAQNAKKPQQTAQSSHVEEGRGLPSDNGYSKQKTAFDKAAEQAWNKLAHKGGIKWTIEGHPEVKMVAVTDDLVKKFPQLEQSRGYQVPFNMSTGTPIMQNIDDKGNIITPDEASEQYTKILTNQDFDYVPKQETAAVQIGSVVNTALSTKGGWLDRMARKSMAQYGDDWEHKKFESDGKEVSSSDVFGKVKQTIYDYYNSVLKGIRTHLMFNSDEEKQAYVDNLYKTGQLKEEDIPKANVLHYVQNVDKEEQIEAVRQAKLNRQLELEMAQEKFNQLPQREKGESDFDYNDRILHEGALYEQDIRKLKKQIAQLDAISDELQGNNTSWKEWGHAFKTSGIGSYHAWDLGATDLKDAIELNKVANGMKRGMQMTSSDYMALRVMSQANEADAIENAVMPVSYKSKKGGFISAPFTFGFFVGGDIAKGLTSAVNKVAGKVISKAVKGAVLKAGGKKALSAATNLAEKAANTKCVKLFGMLAKDFEKAAFMTNITGAAMTGAEILNRHIGTVTESDDGFKMEGESLPTAIINGEISQNIESQTEFLGEHFPSSLKFIRGMAHTKVGSAMGLRNLAAWLTKVSRTEFATTLKSYATRAGINGVFGEYLEEVAGTAENALLVGDQKFSDLLDVKQQEEVAGSVVLSCLGMGIFGTAIYTGQRGLNMPTYYRLKHLQNKWDNAGLDLFTGDEWAKLKDRIDNTPNEGMKSVMADILKADNMTEEQARAAFNYARCSLTLRGMNLGAMKAAQLGLTDDRHIEQDNAYVEGRQAKDEDKHDIQIEFEDRSHELAEKLGISEQQLDNMSDEDLESLTGKDDQLDNLIYDYQTSHAKYQGVVDNADDEIDKAAQEAARQTDMATDKSRGTVRNATIKATKGEEDYGVYIVSGNVATNEDGSINMSESDDMILYYDPKSGKIEHCDAMHLAALGEEVNAEETRNQAIADAKEKAIRKQAGIIDGTVGEGTSFTITDAEGNEHTYEVLADNGDGSAMITMDGNVQDTPVSLQDLQNLKDAEEAKRLEAAKMQRQQYEEEREKQNAPVEDNLDYADIINIGGNVEIAEVVDEEGNAMFPDAEEVFFVQNQGSRAKVMVLDNEGNLQPKLVKKSSVRTLGTMSVDEYRQERQKTLKEAENASEPSLVDETEPSNNVVPTDNVPTDNTTTDNTIKDETQPGNEAEVTTSDETQKISNEQENTPKITLEDGTEVPMLEDGNPDFSQLTAEQVAELYDSQFGEDAGQIITNNVNRSKKALDKANAMTVSGGSFVEQKASKEAKDKAIAEAQAKYDSAKAIEDAYNERMLAKEEDTPEGRMNLIEKARRKFNRMKGSVKDNAQAIAQLYDETVGALLHRLYDSTGIDVFDDTANTVDEYVASSIAPYSLNYEGTETSKGVKQETDLSRSDFAKTGLLAKEGKGKTIGQLANDLWRDRPANLENITDQDVRNAIIDLITSGQTAFGLKNHIQNLRIAEAENILEQQKRQADELAHAEKQKEEEQASTEQSDDNTEESSNTEATPTDAQEEDKLPDMPFEAPSPDEDVPFSAKDKAKDPLEVWNNMTDEEKAAYIENNRVKDTGLVDDVVGKKLRKAIEKIAGMMGATIQWQRTDMIRNGWFNPTTKTVYLALDSSVLEGVQFVFGHEMTHDIKSKSPAMYDELKKLVKEKYGEELFEAMTNDNEKRYADVGKTDDDRSYYEEETVADAIGDMINDLNLTRSIAFKMSHPLLAKMHDVLLKIKNAFTGTPYSDNVKGIIRTIEMAYVKTANREAVNTATQEDEGDVNYVIFKPEDMQIVEDEKFSVKEGINRGYTQRENGDKISKNAYEAEEDGTYSHGTFKRKYKVAARTFPLLQQLGFITNTEWHHTGRNFSKTGFYTWADSDRISGGSISYADGKIQSGSIAAKYKENKQEIDDIVKGLPSKQWEFTKPESTEPLTYEAWLSRKIPFREEDYLSKEEKAEKQANHERISADKSTPSYYRGESHKAVDQLYYNVAREHYQKELEANRQQHEAEYKQYESEFPSKMQKLKEQNLGTNGKEKDLMRIYDLLGYKDSYGQVIKEISRPLATEDIDRVIGVGEKFSLRLQDAINETDPEPTEAQKKSGNYKKGHVKFGGYDYTIENPKGSYRSGVDENGKEWKQKMNDTYGYIRGKFGKDGDHLDMFINDKVDLDNWNGDVYVVDQVNQDGTFDEHKVMYGYDSLDEAKKAYLSNYEKGWTGLGNITPVSKADFDKWLDKSNRKLKPFADYADITSKTNMDTAPSSFEVFLEHPAVRYSIRNEKERAAAEDAYNFAQENRPDRYSRYAIVNMEKPGAVPQYLEKKTVADNWRRYYNKLKWGNYKLFDLDKPFEDNVKNLVGKFPETFRKKNDTTLSKINELSADYNKRKEEYDAMSNSIQELLNGLMKQGRSLAEAESVIRDWGLYKEMDSKYQNLMGIRKQLNELRSGKVADRVMKGLLDGVDPREIGEAKDGGAQFSETINSGDNIRFSLKEEKEKIVADAKANGTYMTAPNGEKTKLNAEQWVTVRTANFKKWFGDWENDPENASKVVDENGEPMVMYHYTDENFTIFGKDKEVGKNTFGNASNASYAATTTIGHWFTSNKNQPEYMGKPMECFLNIVEPFDGYNLEGLADYLNNYISDEDFNSYEEDYENVAPIIEAGNNFRKEKIRDGYDGVVIDDEEFGGTSYVAFNANQIKSAENNNGNFSADNNDIRFSLKSMMEKPEGWKQANKKAIHIAEAIERDPKFSLKNLDGTLIKAGTYFSGGGLVEEGLKGIIDPVVAVEYDEKISGVYRNNFGDHIVTADVRDVDPKELVGKIDGEVEYFHASPVCKNYSLAKNNHEELELDKETAASTAEFISKVRPKVVTIENVKGYKDSEAMKTITDALDEAGYKWDADVYNAADYGGYTNRERLIVRAVRDGELPAKPEKQKRKSGWYEAVEDIMPTLTEKKNGVAPWMDERLKADGIDWRHIDKPLYVMGSGYANGTVPHAFADELLPTLRTKSGDVIVMPDGKVYRAMGRVLARISGVSDDYQMPASEALSHTIIGNGIPTQLTENVIAPLVRDVLHPAVEQKASLKDADRKQTQLDIILKTNPMLDDYHTGIRKVEDIKTLGESVEEARSEAEKYGDDEWSAYPDITNDMLQNALETGEITIYSSKPIKNGVFVTPSYMQASDYAGGGNVYEKTVPLNDVAWINTDEGQYAKVDGERYSLRVDRYRDELNQWKKDNNLPKDAERPQLPVREPNESAADFLKRVKEYRKQAALWATAPTYEDHLLTSDTAQGQFNLEMQRKAVLTRIVIQDSMLAIRKAQEAIMKEKGVDKLNPAEDAYTAENRSHGKAKNEFVEYNDEFLQPLRKAYNELMQRLGKSYDNVKVYMIAKHGLERNAYIAFKYALGEDYETNEERMNAYNNYKADMDRLNNDADFEAGRIDFAAWKQRDGFIRTKYAPSYFKFRFDENGMTKDYSGLSALFDADDYEGAAADLVKEVEDDNPYYTDELWYATNDATKKILRDSYNAGMMTEDNFNFVSGMYRNYIPLRGWGDTNADQVWNYVGGGKGAFNQVVKEAKGRKSLADDPIAYIENMAESAILMNNRNWVKQHLLLLAQNHRTSLLNVSKAWYIKTKDAQGNEEWIPASPQITEGMTGRQVETALEAFEQKMEQMQQNGEATQKREHLEISYPQTNGEEREHEVRVMKGGEEYVIYVNGDPQLAQAVNNTRARKVREGIEESRPQRILARIGRYMAAAYTSMSPLFIPSNYMRDLTMTLASTAIREDARYNYLLRRNMLRHWNTFPMVLSYQNGTLREKVRNGSASRVEEMFYDFMMNGGETGFVTSVDVEDLKKKFKNDLKDLNRMAANPKKVGHIIMNSIETLNRAIEDSNRFMVYMTSIEYGRSIEEAVNNAKDVTLNFNRKGTGEHGWQAVRDMYLFINPAVQSLQTLGALAKHHPFKFTAVTTGWLATGLLVPMLNNLLMSFFGGDDDKDKYWQFTKWDRRNNFIMWIPFTKEFVKIPLAQEFRGFYGVGDMIASKLWGGEKAEEGWSDYAWDLAGQIVDMLPLDPTGYDGNIGLAITPNAARPIGELALNVDFTGKPIFKNSEYNKYDPNFTKAYVGTPDWLVRISKMVNSIDNKYPDVEQNAIDRFGDPKFNPNNPAVIDHLLSSYLGGSYTMGSKIIGVATKALNGDDIKMADIPLASKFVSNPDDRPVSKKQGEEFWDMKERHDRAANTLSKLKKKAKIDGDYSTLDIFFGSDEYRQYKEDDKKVKKYEEDRKKEKAQETGEEYRPHKTTADDVYKSHTTPKDDFEDMKMKQLYEKLNSYKIRYEAIDGISNEKGDAYYKANKAAIDAIEEIAYDKSQIASIKKGFLSDGQNTYDADGMKDIRELRKRILDVLEKANKAMMNNRK